MWARRSSELASIERAHYPDLRAALQANPTLLVVDVRRTTEWQDGHLPTARHVPLHDLPSALAQIAAWSHEAAHAGADPTVWLTCGSGFRAMVAASLLARHGVPVVAVDDAFSNVTTSGLELVTDEHGQMLAGAYFD